MSSIRSGALRRALAASSLTLGACTESDASDRPAAHSATNQPGSMGRVHLPRPVPLRVF
jgi:hypothetical protein